MSSSSFAAAKNPNPKLSVESTTSFQGFKAVKDLFGGHLLVWVQPPLLKPAATQKTAQQPHMKLFLKLTAHAQTLLHAVDQ